MGHWCLAVILKKKQRVLEQNALQHRAIATVRSFYHAWYAQSIWCKRKRTLVYAAAEHFSKKTMAKVVLRWNAGTLQGQELREAIEIVWQQRALATSRTSLVSWQAHTHAHRRKKMLVGATRQCRIVAALSGWHLESVRARARRRSANEARKYFLELAKRKCLHRWTTQVASGQQGAEAISDLLRNREAARIAKAIGHWYGYAGWRRRRRKGSGRHHDKGSASAPSPLSATATGDEPIVEAVAAKMALPPETARAVAEALAEVVDLYTMNGFTVRSNAQLLPDAANM